MDTRSTFFVSLLLVVLIFVGIWVAVEMTGRQPVGEAPSVYSAVYLASGDVYFGKLRWFPWPHLTNVYFLQRNTTDTTKPAFLVVRLTSVFWSPIDSLYLNPRQILFWTRLRQNSDIVSGIEGQNTQEQVLPPPQTQLPGGSLPTPPPPAATTTSSH